MKLDKLDSWWNLKWCVMWICFHTKSVIILILKCLNTEKYQMNSPDWGFLSLVKTFLSIPSPHVPPWKADIVTSEQILVWFVNQHQAMLFYTYKFASFYYSFRCLQKISKWTREKPLIMTKYNACWRWSGHKQILLFQHPFISINIWST